MKFFLSLFLFFPCLAMDSVPVGPPHTLSSLSVSLPRPFKTNTQEPVIEHFKVAQRCHISTEVVRRKERLFLRVKLYYRNLKIMQNEYDLDIDKLSKL